MKRLVIIAMAVLMSCATKAQPHFEGSIGFSGVTGQYPGTGAWIGGSAGFGYRFGLSSVVSFDPMIQLIWQGEKSYGGVYARVPALFSYNLYRVELSAGPYISYGLWDEKNEPRYYDAPSNGESWPIYHDSAFGYFNRLDVGVLARVCYHFPKYYLGVCGSYGLCDISRDDLGQVSSHMLNASLVIGFEF